MSELPFENITDPFTNTTPSVFTLERLISVGLGLITVLGGLTFLFWFMIGALNWITAEGKPEKLEKARNTFIQAIIGLVLLVAAYSLTAVLGKILGLNVLNLKNTIDDLLGP